MEVAGGFFGIDDVMFLGLGATTIAGVAMAGVAGATGGAMIGGGAVAGAAMIVSGDVRKGVADFFSKW